MLPDSPSSARCNSLNDGDQIWGEDDVPSQEWAKLDADFTNAGYREGITAGKESALQEGFDEGFATIGAPLGREIGMLRGAANAAMGYLSSTAAADVEVKPGVDDRLQAQGEELKIIINDLSRLSLVDLAPRDLQAEAHAREHMESSEEAVLSISTNISGDGNTNSMLSSNQLRPLDEWQARSLAATQELNRLRIRLAQLLQELDLTTPLL
ncbi:hypothetical protein BU17DRAFT_66983 [Hysterangium stoloniferum]|nr:hypothetical protein BU17DRAFT_66983 [Hysterangium stoloniferum]